MALRAALVVGTRPEAIKLAPVYLALAKIEGVEASVILTRQHGDMLGEFLDLFRVNQRITLEVERGADSLLAYSGRLIDAFDRCFSRTRFNAVIVQGDTTSALIGAMAGAYHQLPVAHVEAGLRSGTLREPFPEELNRRVISKACRWHFAPTALSAENLRREGLGEGVHTVGNTVVDAAEWVAQLSSTRSQVISTFPKLRPRQYVLVTAHRRESFGVGMVAIAEAIVELAMRNSELQFLVLLHPNPHAREPMIRIASDVDNVQLCDPVGYQTMIGLLADAFAVLSDSGGIQEEAPSFGVPVFVLRSVTERPEGIEAGCNYLVGTDRETIVAEFSKMVSQGIDHDNRKKIANPYGDGLSGKRIAEIISGELR